MFNLLYFTWKESDNADDEKNENDGSESGEAGSEDEDGDDAEAEYLIEFEQTKKLQVLIYNMRKW